jgi:hypothetical protein
MKSSKLICITGCYIVTDIGTLGGTFRLAGGLNNIRLR